MPNIKVYKMDGTEAGTMKLSDKVFGVEYNEPLIHQAVVTRLANERQGTKSTLSLIPTSAPRRRTPIWYAAFRWTIIVYWY